MIYIYFTIKLGKGLGHFTESVSILDSFKKFNDERLLHEFERFCSLLSSDEEKFLFEVLVKKLKKSGDSKDVVSIFNSLMSSDEFFVPISIFASGLSPYESLVKFLKDELKFRLKDIASTLGKSESSVWTTYRNADNKKISLKINYDFVMPLSDYNSKNSVLENVVYFMVDIQGLKIKLVSEILGKSVSTVWTTYNKVKSK